jgi:N6-L-threonylcarbamoyladenine synthase
MNTETAFLGIDTSCYTTSLCFLSPEGKLLDEERRLLQVRSGRCGLQQSEMVYQHTRNLPELMEQALAAHKFQVAGIGVSAQPRPRADSYMPAFLAGLGLARSLGAVLGVPVWRLSHQENHLEAGVWSAGGPGAGRFLLLHASGGTTDLLLAERGGAEGHYQLTELGGSIDLHAGQLVDRVGVALGLGFPCGPALEKLAATAAEKVPVPVSVRGLQLSLSGPATSVLRAIKAGAEPAAVAAGVQQSLGTAFAKLLVNGAEAARVQDVLLVGGVGANAAIRSLIESKLQERGLKLWVPDPHFSGDNASGCAAFAVRQGVKS